MDSSWAVNGFSSSPPFLFSPLFVSVSRISIRLLLSCALRVRRETNKMKSIHSALRTRKSLRKRYNTLRAHAPDRNIYTRPKSKGILLSFRLCYSRLCLAYGMNTNTPISSLGCSSPSVSSISLSLFLVFLARTCSHFNDKLAQSGGARRH